jgi:Ca2+-binding EF-hand superfamily protein
MAGFTRRIRIALAGVVVAALPGLALAQPTAPAAPRTRMFEKCDANGDGVLDKAELRERHRLRKAALVRRFDLNGNGVLDPAERKQARRVKIDRMLARLDTDGSGTISRAEAMSNPRSVLARKFAVIDIDGDQVLSVHELLTARAIKLNPGVHGKGKRHRRPQPA